MCGLTLMSILIKGCCPGKPGQPNMVVNSFGEILAMEILLEDIPQFVLTSLIIVDKGLLTPTGALNMATSAFNFVFNLLDMCEPDPEVLTEDPDEEIVEEDDEAPAAVAEEAV